MIGQANYSAAWRQFLLAKRAMLAEYDRALAHAKTQAVVTHHGNVAEAALRDWLSAFLPKRYGVTSGYVRSQGLDIAYQSPHFDVIIYDQLESPILWIEENRDKSDGGRTRIVPAEHVGAVIEVKSSFSRRAVSDAINKLHELDPVMASLDGRSERYPKYFRPSTVLGMLFFELRNEDARDLVALDLVKDASFGRGFYGGVILRGDGRELDDTARVQQVISDNVMEPLFTGAGLLHNTAMAATNKGLQSAMISWSTIAFSDFAFDLLAFLNGTYELGRASSFHGLDFSAWNTKSE